MPTTSEGFRYPASTDHTRLWEHIQNLASDLNAAISSIKAVTSVTTGLSPATGFSVNALLAKKTSGVCSIFVYLGVTTTITVSGGNISPDTLCCTLPSGTWPPAIAACVWDNGTAGGGGIINTDGTVYLRSATGSISAGSNIQIAATYVQ